MNIAQWLETNWSDPEGSGSGARYWFRTPMGLETMVADEIRSRFEAARLFQSHRNIFAAMAGGAGRRLDQLAGLMRTADDVYRYIGCCHGIDNTKQSVEQLISFFADQVIPLLSEYRDKTYIRLTLSFVGKRNFNRFFVENKFNELVTAQTGLQPLSNEEKAGNKAGELRLRCHIENDVAFIGMGLKDVPLHRRPWRNIKYTAQLHTPVAAVMVRALAPKAGTMIIDPFCGSGTILIESAIQYPKLPHRGYDINMDAVKAARESAGLAGVKATFQLRDSLKCTPEQNDYYLISNPPWDEKHEISGGNSTSFIRQLIRLISGSSGAVLLLPEEMVSDLRKQADFPIHEVAQTRVRGKLAMIIRITNQ